jgi:hypothetical protein
MDPLSLDMRMRLIVQYLAPMGEYQEVSSFSLIIGCRLVDLHGVCHFGGIFPLDEFAKLI